MRPRSRNIFCSFLSGMLLASVSSSAIAQSNINLRIMPLGDSITAGYLSTTWNGYRGPLANALSNQVGTVDFVGGQIEGLMGDPDDEGHMGWRIDQIASVANAQLNTYKPNVVTLDIGINDLGQFYQVATAPARLAALIDQVLTAQPDATVLVAQLIVNSTSNVQSEVVAFNQQLPAIVQSRANAGKHVYLVDMSAITLADLSDGLHPNDTGYQLMANAWDAGLQKVIANHWITDPVGGSATRPTGTIYSGVAGMCLEDFNGSGTRGVKAEVSTCNPIAAQQWNVNNSQVVINGLCLDVVANGTGNHSLVDLWNCSGNANQVWLARNGALVNPISGRCLDDPNFSTTNGTQLELYDCSGGPNQQWRVASEGSVVSGTSGNCLDAYGGNAVDLTPADSYGCNNSPAQQWKITNNTLTFDGKCLDVLGGGTTNNTLVGLYTCHGGAPNQVWVPVNGTLLNPASGRCLNIPVFSTNGVLQLDILDCNTSSSQRWVIPLGSPQS